MILTSHIFLFCLWIIVLSSSPSPNCRLSYVSSAVRLVQNEVLTLILLFESCFTELNQPFCPGMIFQSQYWLVSLTFHIWLVSMFFHLSHPSILLFVAVTILIRASFLFAWIISLAFPVPNPSSHSPFYASQLKYSSRETPAIIWFFCSKLREALYHHGKSYTNKAFKTPRKSLPLAWA